MSEQETEPTSTPPSFNSPWAQAAATLSQTVTLLRQHAARLRALNPSSAEALQFEERADALDRLGVEGELALARKWEEARIEDWSGARDHDRAWVIKNAEQIIQLALSAIRGAVLVNGGALVALLAFLGNVWSKGWPVAEFARSFACFAFGLLSAVLTGALSYAAQYFYGDMDGAGQPSAVAKTWAPRYHVAAIVLFGCSLASFGVGCYEAFGVFERSDSSTNGRAAVSDEERSIGPSVPQRLTTPPPKQSPTPERQPSISPPPPTAPANPPAPFSPSKPSKPPPK